MQCYYCTAAYLVCPNTRKFFDSSNAVLGETFIDSSNAVLGETFTPPPPKKGNQTFVLRRRNLYCIQSKTKSKTKKAVKIVNKASRLKSRNGKIVNKVSKSRLKSRTGKICQQSHKKSSKKPHRKNLSTKSQKVV